MRWLDALGPFKWPSLALIAAPVAAYPFWLPDAEPAAPCGRVAFDGGTFDVYRTGDGLVLRPLPAFTPGARAIAAPAPRGFDNGGMRVDAAALAGADLACARPS